MQKPKSLVIEESTLEIQDQVNKISKKNKLTFFDLKIILKVLLDATIAAENEEVTFYKSEIDSKKKGDSNDNNKV